MGNFFKWVILDLVIVICWWVGLENNNNIFNLLKVCWGLFFSVIIKEFFFFEIRWIVWVSFWIFKINVIFLFFIIVVLVK